MKKLLAVTLSILMTLGMMSSNVLAEEKITFSDISGHWAEQDIKKIASEGIISGYPDGTFKPDAPITRAEFAKIATLAFDLQVKSVLNYDDVKPDDWYYSYLENCDTYIPIYPLPVGVETNIPYQIVLEQGLASFLPNTPAMRMHIAEALVKIKIEKENISVDIPDIKIIQQELLGKFNDSDYVNLYAMHGKVPVNVQRMFEYTWLASELGIMQGDDNGNFNPYGYVTRAELVTMIKRMIVKTSATPIFYNYSDLFDMELDGIKIMEIQSGSTGEKIKINSRETIEKVFSLLSTSQYKTDVRSGNYDGWSYAVTMFSNDGEQLFRYVINTGIKIGEHNYLIEDDTYKFKTLIDEIYNTPLEKKKFTDISDVTLDDIDTIEIQSGVTGEFVKVNSRETIEQVFSILSESTYTQDVLDGFSGGFRYALNLNSKDGTRLFSYVINAGVNVDDIVYIIEEIDVLTNALSEIYTNVNSSDISEEKETIVIEELNITLILPDDWENRYALEKSDNGEYIVYNPDVRKAFSEESNTENSGGVLFYIVKWDEKLSESEANSDGEWNFANNRYITTVEDGTYFLYYASDVQFTKETENEYRKMESEIENIKFVFEK